MFDLPPQEICKQAFERHKTMTSLLPDLSIRVWSAINLCFRHSQLYNPTNKFCDLTSPDFDPRHDMYSIQVWDKDISAPDLPSHVDTTAYRQLLLDARSWDAEQMPFYSREVYERQNRLRDLAEFSGYGVVRRIMEDMWQVKKEGMRVYEDWKDADGEGVRVCGELMEEGRRLIERAEALLKCEVGGGEGNTVRRRRT